MQNYKTGELETASYRISKTAWLKEEEHPHVANIYRFADFISTFFCKNKPLRLKNQKIKNILFIFFIQDSSKNIYIY